MLFGFINTFFFYIQDRINEPYLDKNVYDIE